jgi:hypothetical protein
MGSPERVSAISVEHTHNDPLRTVLWDTLLSTTVEKDYRPDRSRQETIFDRIDWNQFRTDVAESGKGTGAGAGKQLRGRIFEMLIQADPVFGERSLLEEELLKLAHTPEAFGLGKELGHHRNPDMAFLIVQKEDGIEIVGVGESKLGLLNDRSYKQLSETGFARGVNALVNLVNTLPDPAAYGLVEVAKARKEVGPGKPVLTVSSEFSQLLVVPANRHIEWPSSLVNRKEFSAQGRQNFYDLLDGVKIARAAFSTAEVSEMAKFFIV